MALFLPTHISRARRALLFAIVLCCAWSGVAADASREIEAQVKAAFLPKLANFVTWPASAFAETNSPLVIGILGEDPFGPQFDEDLKSVVIHGRPMVVKRLGAMPKPGAVHLLFVGQSATARIGDIRKTLGKEPILTLGDASGFAEAGGMINFTKVEGKLRFEINITAAQASGLQISSRLLQVSTVVRGKDKP